MAHLTNFSFEFFQNLFTEDASLPLLYHGAKKVKNDQKLKSRGGSCHKSRARYTYQLRKCFMAANPKNSVATVAVAQSKGAERRNGSFCHPVKRLPTCHKKFRKQDAPQGNSQRLPNCFSGLAWSSMGGQPTPFFFLSRIREEPFFSLQVVNDNETVRNTFDGVERKSGSICLVRYIRRCCWCRPGLQFLVTVDNR